MNFDRTTIFIIMKYLPVEFLLILTCLKSVIMKRPTYKTIPVVSNQHKASTSVQKIPIQLGTTKISIMGNRTILTEAFSLLQNVKTIIEYKL